MGIPTTSDRVNVVDLHPILAYRVGLLLADSRMAGYRVVSGVRTYEQQKRLYDGWLRRLIGYNLAANPDRTITWTFDGLKVAGSWHMVQSDQYGHAVDLRRPWYHTPLRARRIIREIGLKLGLNQTEPGEGWHLQARNSWKLFKGPMPPPINTETYEDEEEDDMDSMTTYYDTHTKQAWVGMDGKADEMNDAAAHMASWEGPIRKSDVMRYIVPKFFTIIP